VLFGWYCGHCQSKAGLFRQNESAGLYNPQQIQNDEDDGNNDQGVNEIAGFWNTRTDVTA
jgi:hypothetical protein